MGSTNGNGDEKEKLPLAPDLDQIFNRISMGLNHHSLLARSLKKKPTTTSTASTSSTTNSNSSNSEATTTTTTTKKGFSSLINGFSSTKQLSTSLNEQRRSEKTNPDRQADLDALFAEPPNAGLGYVPPTKSASGSSTPSLTGDKEKDRKLRAQILGGRASKRGREDEQNSNKNLKRGGKGHDSDSDEDVGRSALGRSKRLRTGVESAGVAVARKRTEEKQVQTEKVDNNIGKKEEDGVASTAEQPLPAPVAAEQEEKDADIPKEKTVAQGQASEAGEEVNVDGGGGEEAKEKKKKKKKSKNSNKKKKKTEDGAPPKEGEQGGDEEED